MNELSLFDVMTALEYMEYEASEKAAVLRIVESRRSAIEKQIELFWKTLPIMFSGEVLSKANDSNEKTFLRLESKMQTAYMAGDIKKYAKAEYDYYSLLMGLQAGEQTELISVSTEDNP